MKQIFVSLSLLMPLFSFAGNSVDKEEVRRKIRENIQSFKGCYKERLEKTNSKIGGKVVLEWDFDDSGSVKNAKINSTTLNDSIVENCMVDKLKALKFPPAPKGEIVNIIYPFVLSPTK